MRIEVETVGDVKMLTAVEPRLNAAGAVAFKDAVRAATTGHPGRVVMDMTRVEFLDSSGLGALVAVMKILPSKRLELAGTGPVVKKVLSLTKMDRVFVLHADRDAALAPRTAA